jgi:hypothetical protein
MQNSRYIVNPTRNPTKVPILQSLEIGKLIGHGGRNINPIAEGTGTSIVVNTATNPAQFEITINQNSNVGSFSSSRNQINEAKVRLNNLIKDHEKESKRQKGGKSVEFLNNFDSRRPEVLRYQKEINAKKEKRKFKRDIMSTINSYMRGEGEEYGEHDEYGDDEYQYY